MFEKAILPLALGACLAFAAPAWAEGDSPDNPKPLADDVALPLPCGGEMVFRHVYVLAEGALDDREVNLGYAFNEGEAGYQQSFISGYRRDYVNGQFSLADLAPAWQQKLSASLPKPAAGTPLKPMLYFIGKYEVTARQYAAVMSQAAALSGQGEAPACDVPDGMAARLPKVNLSRFDAERFGAVYSAWLLKNHPELLPVSGRGKNPEDGGIGFSACPPRSSGSSPRAAARRSAARNWKAGCSRARSRAATRKARWATGRCTTRSPAAPGRPRDCCR